MQNRYKSRILWDKKDCSFVKVLKCVLSLGFNSENLPPPDESIEKQKPPPHSVHMHEALVSFATAYALSMHARSENSSCACFWEEGTNQLTTASNWIILWNEIHFISVWWDYKKNHVNYTTLWMKQKKLIHNYKNKL